MPMHSHGKGETVLFTQQQKEGQRLDNIPKNAKPYRDALAWIHGRFNKVDDESRSAWENEFGKTWSSLLKSDADKDGTKIILTAAEKEFGLVSGVLDETDFEGSIAREEGDGDESFFDPYTRDRKPTDEFPDLSKSELIRQATLQEGKCWVHGGSLLGYYQKGNRQICQHRVVQAHYPSKRAAKEAGMILTKKHIHAACKVCNDLMTDAFGVTTPEDEMRNMTLRKAAARRIQFFEPSQVREERRLVEEIVFVKA